MWSERDQATIEAYRTFACEIALYAYNDYIKYSIDIFCLEHPLENDFTEKRFRRLSKVIMYEAVRNQKRRGRKGLSHEQKLRMFCKEIPFAVKQYREKAENCKRFFKDPHPICGLLGLDGDKILENADKQIERWIAGEDIHLKKSIRGLYFDGEEEFE